MRISISLLPKKIYTRLFFSCRYSTFEYLVMPFGLINAPTIFQRVIDKVIFSLLDSCIVIYLDKILVFSHTRLCT